VDLAFKGLGVIDHHMDGPLAHAAQKRRCEIYSLFHFYVRVFFRFFLLDDEYSSKTQSEFLLPLAYIFH